MIDQETTKITKTKKTCTTKTKIIETMSTKLLTDKDLSTDIAADAASDVKATTPKAVVDYVGIVPKRYMALLTQSGTDAPTFQILENTLGEIDYNYVDAGIYECISAGLFTINTAISIACSVIDAGDNSSSGRANAISIDENTIRIFSLSRAPDLSDRCLYKTKFCIEVY